jgi:hypothetical protein
MLKIIKQKAIKIWFAFNRLNNIIFERRFEGLL